MVLLCFYCSEVQARTLNSARVDNFKKNSDNVVYSSSKVESLVRPTSRSKKTGKISSSSIRNSHLAGKKKTLIQPTVKDRIPNELPCFPTHNSDYLTGKLELFIQPTISGNVLSGTYGCVRNGGSRFHDGIDVKSIQRDRHNEPMDEILAILSGRVAYINAKPQDSDYGRYIILEHKEGGLLFYTLYAHLAKVDTRLKVNSFVKKSQTLGIMGHSSSLGIPVRLAHLHHSIGFRLGYDNLFENWYKTKGFATPNKHGCWNGLNLVGLDPLEFLNSKKTFSDFLKQQITAFQLSFDFPSIPTFITQNPGLLKKPIPQKVLGWKVSFNWVGCPITWEPLTEKPKKRISVEYINKEELFKHGNRHTLELNKKGNPYIGKTLKRQLFELFGESFTL